MLAAIAILASASAAAQPVQSPPLSNPVPLWQPSAAYVTIGQDEPGYRSWYIASPRHAFAVGNFNRYLTTYGVGGVVPTWQLLRTASSWQRCGAQPFEVPPTSEWPNVVQTLRYVRDYVIPAVGPVEPVSGYRNPVLNQCAGGAPESAHKHYSAVDLVPLRAIAREDLMRTLCVVHARKGLDYGVGLGFYAFLRFHVDTTKFRRWGTDSGSVTCPPIIRPADIASVYQPPEPIVAVPVPVPAPVQAPAPDPLAPAPAGPSADPTDR